MVRQYLLVSAVSARLSPSELRRAFSKHTVEVHVRHRTSRRARARTSSLRWLAFALVHHRVVTMSTVGAGVTALPRVTVGSIHQLVVSQTPSHRAVLAEGAWLLKGMKGARHSRKP